MLVYLPALSAALIWAYCVIIYRQISIRSNVISVNIWRLVSSTLFLFILSLLFTGFNLSIGLVYASLSGMITLGIGDTLYFYSCVMAGASVATPIVFTYIIFIQLTASLFGEPLTLSKIIASIMAFIGITILSRKREGEGVNRFKGVILAVISMFVWVIGQTALKPAVIYSDPIDVTFIRSLTGLITLTLIYSGTAVKHINMMRTDKYKLLVLGVLDIGIGAYLYILSISLLGLSITVILTSLMPLFTQILAIITKTEKVTIIEVLSAILIILAIILCIS